MADLTTTNGSRSLGADIERVLVEGDLGLLTPQQRVHYYQYRCAEMGISAAARPFDFLKLNGKLVLYANRTCADLLRAVHKISIEITSAELQGDVYVVRAKATLPDGRVDESTGAVPVGGLKGEALSNAYLKAETKAKRRVTISVVGLGLLDEIEASTIPTARPVQVTDDGEIIQEATPEQRAARLLEYSNRIDEAVTVADLMEIYHDALKDTVIEKDSVPLIKKQCGAKRKRIEEETS